MRNNTSSETVIIMEGCILNKPFDLFKNNRQTAWPGMNRLPWYPETVSP
jgi:hypothetical protein